ncbi:MAG: helix-turn-helix domain-containing protein [Paludibacteraceae bacterium]|nr:helix-turn-helix domain-containing protein [Paludibacteraceae bacterium]
MENSVKIRVKSAIKELGISCYEIAKSCGISDRTVTDQINGNSKIGIITLCALLQYRPDLSAEWLLRGEGDMLKGGKSSHISIVPTSNDERTMNERLDNKDIAQLKDTISRQQREIDGLYERIDELKRATSIAAPHSVTAV